MIHLRAVLVDAEVSQLDISRIEIVVTEILNNIVKHAQRELDQGWFEVQCSFRKEGFHFACRDNGAPMPNGTPPGGVMPEFNPSKNDLPEGGWGWSLVRALSANLSYVRNDDINLVSFRIPSHTSTLGR